MTSEPVRDPWADHLLTPQNCALIIIATGRNQPTIAPLQDVLPGIAALDRTTLNSWEDTEFRQAVRATGRRKLIMAALWTEACLTFPSLDAMREGYETYPVADAVGGTSPEAHQAGLDRIAQAGGQPTSVARWGANCSGTGPAGKPPRTSRRSCSAESEPWPEPHGEKVPAWRCRVRPPGHPGSAARA
jgi:hypothetical protein